jgi:hypothetical protein
MSLHGLKCVYTLILILFLSGMGSCGSENTDFDTSSVTSKNFEETTAIIVSETMVKTTSEVTVLSSVPQRTISAKVTTTALSTQEGRINSVRSTNKKTGILFPLLSDYLIETRDDSHYFDISALKLRASMTNDVSTDAVIQTLIPSYERKDYKIYKNANNESGDHFTVGYDLKIGEYTTNKGYTVIYDNNQATHITESLISFSVSSVDVSKLPAVTDEIIVAAYKQAQDEVLAQYPLCLILKKEGEPYFDVETNACYFKVKTTYAVDASGYYKGVIYTKYRISQ